MARTWTDPKRGADAGRISAGLIWTPEALNDVRRLHRFPGPNNPAAAFRAVRAIRGGMGAVAAHPGSGRPVPDMDPTFREWLISFGDDGYVALHRVHEGQAVVLAVRHR